MKCPVCGGESWRTSITGAGFHIEECVRGCIGRTVPPPQYSSVLPPGARVENLIGDKKGSGHFRIAGEILRAVSRFQPGGRLLDIGSGWGQLLRLALDMGYDAVGLEASPGAAEIARQAFGVDSVEGYFPEHTFELRSFDVVVMNHVLEHLPEPEGALSEAKRILRPGGLLAVSAPNFGSLMSRVKGSEWVGLQPTQHVWQLSARSIEQLLRRSGFTRIMSRSDRLDYGRGTGSLPRWLALRAILGAAQVLNLGDNAIVLART